MKIIGVNEEIRKEYEQRKEEEEKKHTKEIECKECGAILRYDIYRDVKEWDMRENAYESNVLYTYVVCPYCREKVITEDYRKK